MKKVSLVLFIMSILFVSCTKDNTTDISNNNQQQGEDKDGKDGNNDQGNDDNNSDDNDNDDDQGVVNIIGKWTAESITLSGTQDIDVGYPVEAKIKGDATDSTVGNVSYEFKENPNKVTSLGKFDINITASVPVVGTVYEETMTEQVFGASGDWVLSQDGKTVTIKDATTGEDVIMGVTVEGNALTLTGKVVKEFEYEGQKFSPELDIVAKFTK